MQRGARLVGISSILLVLSSPTQAATGHTVGSADVSTRLCDALTMPTAGSST